jgi:IS30 family transposase
MENKKHLTFSDRNRIQGGLANRKSFNQIALELGKSPSTISREVKLHKHYERKGAKWSRFFNDCRGCGHKVGPNIGE